MKAIYAFSGDPITFGHIDIVQRASRTYDHVTVAIGNNPAKHDSYLFTRDERLALTEMSLRHIPNVSCLAFSDLLAEFAYRNGHDVIVRGVRNAVDLEGELVQAAVSESLHPGLDTVFFPTRPIYSHISSSVVKAIVLEGGDVSSYCPLVVKEALEKRILGRYAIGVAGGIGSGKTTVAKRLVAGLSESVTASYISLDEVGHYVLGTSVENIYRDTRDKVAERFGRELIQSDGSIHRHDLGKIVFATANALADLNGIMREPMLARLHEESREHPAGILVIEGAILVEARWTNFVNNNIILVDAPEDIRLQRLIDRGDVDKEHALNKIQRQIDAPERDRMIKNRIAETGWGHLYEIENAGGELDLTGLIGEIIVNAVDSVRPDRNQV